MWQLEVLLTGMVSNADTEKMKKSQTLTRAMIPERYRTPMSKYVSVTTELMHENWQKNMGPHFVAPHQRLSIHVEVQRIHEKPSLQHHWTLRLRR